MSEIYFFRGKAATGKTTITDILSKKINVPVLRKDDIFDLLSKHVEDSKKCTNITYDLLIGLIQTCINNDTDIIVDVGLSDTKGWIMFLDKLDFRCSKIITFLCDCSDLTIWKKRHEERLKNPSPNQFFKSIDEVMTYYANSQIELLENEHYIDSSEGLENIMEFVYDKIIDYKSCI